MGIPKEIQEFLSEKKLKLTAQIPVRLHHETKGEKFDVKVLGLSHCRMFILSSKPPIKIENTVHFLDMRGLISASSNQLVVRVQDSKAMTFSNMDANTADLDNVVKHIATSMAGIFPGVALEKLVGEVSLTPKERKDAVLECAREEERKGPRPCAGFTRMYRCMCDYHGCPLMEEVVWDLDTIYLSQNCRELVLHDFDHLSPRDHVPLLSALQHNTWFTRVNVSGMKLNSDAQGEIVKVIVRNTAIEEWNLAGIGIKSDFVQKMSAALSGNPATNVTSFNLSDNLIEDRGLGYLAAALADMRKGVQSLNLAHCGVTGKGLGKLADSFMENKNVLATLHTLVLAGNSFRGDDLSALCSFLAQPNALRKLDMSCTDFATDTLVSAMSRGCLLNMEDLNLSGNPFTSKKGKEVAVPQTWKQFFTSVLALGKVNLSGTRLGPTALKQLLLGLSSNVNRPKVYLDISGNDLRLEGASVLGSCIGQLNNVDGLDISDNGFETSLPEIFPWLAQNKTLTHLSVGRNFANLKPKQLTAVLESLVRAIQDDNCALQSLNISDSKLKVETTIIINALGSNNSLRTLDISGNAMGDIGAKMLAKALTINSALTCVRIDRNSITAQGLNDIAMALDKNRTLLELPLPVCDITAAAGPKGGGLEVAQQAVEKIQTCLQRNHCPQRMTYDPNYRLQQGFLVSSTRNVIDKYITTLEEKARLLEGDVSSLPISPDEAAALAEATRALVGDADNSKEILTKLQDVATQCETSPNFISSDLDKVSQGLRTTFAKQLTHNVDEMLATARAVCPHMLQGQGVSDRLQGGCKEKAAVDERFLNSIITKTLAADIANKISHINFTVASFISDTVIDTAVESLSRQHTKMSRALHSGAGSEDRDSLSTQDADNGFVLVAKSEERNGREATSPGDERKSVLQDLKRRPQSVRADLRGLLRNDSLDSSPLAPDRTPRAAKPKPVEEDSLFPDLEPTAPALTHITKNRPRRPKTKQVRPNYRGSDPPGAEPSAVTTSMTGDTAAGVDNFFESAPAPPTQPVMVQDPPTPSSPAPEKKAEASTPPSGDKTASPKLGKKKAPMKGKDKQQSSGGLFGLFKKKDRKESVDKGRSKDKKSSTEKVPEEGSLAQQVVPESPKSPGLSKADTEESKPAVPDVKNKPMSGSIRSAASVDLDKSEDEKEKEEAEDQPKAAPRRVVGGVGIPGMGGADPASMMAEMRAKRQALEKQPKGHVPSQAMKPPPRPTSKPASFRKSKPLLDSPESTEQKPSEPTPTKPEPPAPAKDPVAKDTVSGVAKGDPAATASPVAAVKDKPRAGSVNKPSPARPAPPAAAAKPPLMSPSAPPASVIGESGGNETPSAAATPQSTAAPTPPEKPKPLRPPKPAAKPRPATRPTTIDASDLLGDKDSPAKEDRGAVTPSSADAKPSPGGPETPDAATKPARGPVMKPPEKGPVTRPPPPASLATSSARSSAGTPLSPTPMSPTPLSPTNGSATAKEITSGGEASEEQASTPTSVNGSGDKDTSGGGNSVEGSKEETETLVETL